ncbi:MAG: hypothetical protein JRI23_20965 [Deltaproteobacteria bacterium]|nr:hypothetical protein [Deltaproteobacteria bacterium]MBW2534405.1 hypothetical protein [Deltaproteobacteria bacterium]
MVRVLDGLHPTAKQVLERTHGVWLADHLQDAAAVYFPCDMAPGGTRGGFVLLDAGEYPFDLDLQDVDVPVLYWQALAGVPLDEPFAASWDRGRGSQPVRRGDHAMRYLLLHELGHALSLYAGEFELAPTGRFQVERTDGFLRFSWRLAPSLSSRGAARHPVVAAAGVAPKVSLSLLEWASVLDALDADPALLSPAALFWVHPTSRQRARRVCRAATKLTRAGFVTPAAALYPTEDYAETFAHAILAAEQRLSPHDRIHLDLPHCGAREIRAPFFSPWITAKRRYLQIALGL